MMDEDWVDWDDLTPEQQAEIENAPCRLRHQEPFDFAWCETHDTTFALGNTCRYSKDKEHAPPSKEI